MNEYKNYKITISIIFVCIIYYLYTFLTISPDMNGSQGIQAGAFNPLYVIYYHQYWRLLTANIVHYGLLHLLVNVYSMFVVGRYLELLIKPAVYLLIILFSALGTTVLPLILYLLFNVGISTASGGLSGIVFGLVGALLALARVKKSIFRDIAQGFLPSLIIMLALSLLVPSISLFGHLGGLVGGFIGTYLISKSNINIMKNNYFN